MGSSMVNPCEVIAKQTLLLIAALILGLVTVGAYEGVDDLIEKAKKGDAEAQFNLGWAYYIGDGVSRDRPHAINLFRLAAEQGNAKAQEHLGGLYHSGIGVQKDAIESVKWVRLAANQGNAKAQTALGAAYAQGDGVQMDDVEAIKWYRLAAEQGDSGGQFMLGMRYSLGSGIPMDYLEAYKWLNLAAASGYRFADERREKVAEKMTPEQIAEAQKLSREWKPTVKK